MNVRNLICMSLILTLTSPSFAQHAIIKSGDHPGEIRIYRGYDEWTNPNGDIEGDGTVRYEYFNPKLEPH